MSTKGEGNRYRIADVYPDGRPPLRVLIYNVKCQELVDLLSKHMSVDDVTGTSLDDEEHERIDVVFTFRCPEEVLSRLTSLKWIQSTGTGIDGFLDYCRKRPDILITATKGFAAESAASVVLLATLAFHWNLLGRLKDQQRHHWEPYTNYTMEPLISTRTMGIVGLGQIGSMIAGHAKRLGMRVIGTKRQPAPIEFVDRVYPPDQLHEMLGQSDFVALALPLVQGTMKLFGPMEFKAMKRSGVIINVARGGIIDEDALLAALRDKTIAGAALDVFQQEPLPPESPLWDAPNLIVTPHIAGNRVDFYEASAAFFAENLKVFPDRSRMRGLGSAELGY